MNIIKLTSVLILILVAAVAFGQNKNSRLPQKEILEVKLNSIGKCPPAYNIKIGKINRKYITSVLNVYEENSEDLIVIPINDKLFNYDYFHRHIYQNMEGRKVKIKVEKYLVKGKTIYVAYNIEEVL